MFGIFEFCRNKFLMGVYEVEQSRGISGNSRNQGYLREATCPAALAWREEVAKRLPSLHRMNEWMNDEWMMMIQKVSSISLKLGTPTVYADLIFFYFQIAAEQTSYGFSRGELHARGDLPARRDWPCRVSEKRGSREATSLSSSS